MMFNQVPHLVMCDHDALLRFSSTSLRWGYVYHTHRGIDKNASCKGQESPNEEA